MIRKCVYSAKNNIACRLCQLLKSLFGEGINGERGIGVGGMPCMPTEVYGIKNDT